MEGVQHRRVQLQGLAGRRAQRDGRGVPHQPVGVLAGHVERDGEEPGPVALDAEGLDPFAAPRELQVVRREADGARHVRLGGAPAAERRRFELHQEVQGLAHLHGDGLAPLLLDRVQHLVRPDRDVHVLHHRRPRLLRLPLVARRPAGLPRVVRRDPPGRGQQQRAQQRGRRRQHRGQQVQPPPGHPAPPPPGVSGGAGARHRGPPPPRARPRAFCLQEGPRTEPIGAAPRPAFPPPPAGACLGRPHTPDGRRDGPIRRPSKRPSIGIPLDTPRRGAYNAAARIPRRGGGCREGRPAGSRRCRTGTSRRAARRGSPPRRSSWPSSGEPPRPPPGLAPPRRPPPSGRSAAAGGRGPPTPGSRPG